MKHLFNGGWSFLCMPVGTGYEKAREHIEEFCEVDIPHDWLIYDSNRLYEDGTGWYYKKFSWEKKPEFRAFLTFEGIYMDSVVYINGKKAGEWKYGYSSFTLEITEFLLPDENEVMVSACFQSPNSRWYSGAGIYRNVWLRVTEAFCIEEDGVYISTKKQGEDFVLQVETDVNCETSECDVKEDGGNIEPGAQERRIMQKCPTDLQTEHLLYAYSSKEGIGEQVQMEFLSEEGNCKKYLVRAPKLWDVETPCMYRLKTRLICEDKILDEAENPVGFRSVEFHPQKGFLLNGRVLKLNGVCEHHDLGALGAAFHKPAMRRKLQILKKMGVNALRGSHNMTAPGVLELADEMGILMISEAFDMWERSKTTYDYARFFKEWSAKDVKSWVCRDRNHPCVIMWSIGNEIYDTHADEHGVEITKYLMELVQTYDPYGNAKVTVGSNYMPWENAQKCADIYKLAGYNYSEKYYKEHHKKHPDWVIYGSETSSIVQSRGVYHFPLKAGILAEDDMQCSALGNSATSWGARSMEDCITMDRDMEFSMGQFLWTGFDYIGEPTPYHTKNSYFGQIDTAGFPKDSYYVWQSAWTDYRKNPMVHVFPYWDFNPGQMIDVRVCSNGPVVELFINGKSLGRQELTHAPGSGKKVIADYTVPYEEGVLTAVAYDEQGREIARGERYSFGDSSKIVLCPENDEIEADGRDLLFVQIGTVDTQGRPVENACDRVQVEVTGEGRLIGLDNGDSTDYDSYKGKTRRLFNGKLLAIIQAGEHAGEIKLKVSGEGLIGAEQVFCSKKAERTEPVILCKEENTDRPVVLGSMSEVPVRKILLQTKGGRVFTPENREIEVRARILPENAMDRELIFKAVNDMGVDSNLVSLEQKSDTVLLRALGDGEFRLRCMSKCGTDSIRLISQLEFQIQGLGQAYLNPYGFISGSQYSLVKGEAGNGNERGVATARDGETVVTYTDIDFGDMGSDEITVPVFALTGDEYPIQIWEGVPGEAGSSLLADAVYQKPSIWNVYQPETWRLNKFLKGITSVSFSVRQKIHIKGFSFKEYQKARMCLKANEADALYGDSFVMKEDCVEEIGNNVSLVFRDMDFGKEPAKELLICGRAQKGNNTIHVRFFNGEEEVKQIVEFEQCREWKEQRFALQPMAGKWEVTFVFLPGSCFDFQWFRFH